MKWEKKTLIILFIGFDAILLTLIGCHFYYDRPAVISDLLYTDPPAPPAPKNAAITYRQCGKALVINEPTNKALVQAFQQPTLSLNTLAQNAIVTDFFRKNQIAFSCMKQGLQLIEYQEDASLVPTAQPLNQLQYLNFIQAAHAHQSGKPEQALEGLVDAATFVSQIGQSHSLFTQALAVSHTRLLFTFFSDFLKHHKKISTPQLRSFLGTLKQFDFTPDQQANLWKKDFTNIIAIWDTQPDIRTIPFLFYPNRSKEELGNYYRTLVANTKAPYGQEKPLPKVEYPSPWEFVMPNIMGKILLYSSAPHYESLNTTYFEASARTTLMKTAIALRLYENNHHKLPEELRLLAPQYLEHPPLDPFNQKPLGYSQTTRTLYSVGTALTPPPTSELLGQPKEKASTLPPNNGKYRILFRF